MNVIVVGAGVIGCAVGHELASRGASVKIIDARGPGGGATHASAGMLAPYIEGHNEALLALSLGSLALYDAFVARVSAEGGCPIEYERSGTLQIARTSEDVSGLDAAARRFVAMGVAHSMLTGDEVQRLEPALSPDLVAGLLLPDHGFVRVGQLMAGLVAAASHHGVTWLVEPASRIDAPGGRPSVIAGNIRHEADAVIVAAGSWTTLLCPSTVDASAVKPIRGQLLHLQCPARPASRVLWGPECYAVPWADGSLLVGATAEDVGFDESATVAGTSRLLEAAMRLLPVTREARFSGVRVGLRPATPDQLPVIGVSSTMPGVYYATGHFRSGILLAPVTAALVGDLVMNGHRAQVLDFVRPDRLGL